VSFRGNRYSVPPNLHGSSVTLAVRLDGAHLDIATASSGAGKAAALPTVIARHRMAPTGAGVMVRQDSHVTALDQAAMNAATTEPPHRSKQRRPPTPAARAEAAALRGDHDAAADDVVVDLARYAAAATGRNTLHGASPATVPSEGAPTPSKQTPQPGTTIKENDQP